MNGIQMNPVSSLGVLAESFCFIKYFNYWFCFVFEKSHQYPNKSFSVIKLNSGEKSQKSQKVHYFEEKLTLVPTYWYQWNQQSVWKSEKSMKYIFGDFVACFQVLSFFINVDLKVTLLGMKKLTKDPETPSIGSTLHFHIC